MINERAIAYSEVYAILKLIDVQYINKIPDQVITIIKEEMDKNYKPHINLTVPLKEQNLNPKTYTILAVINLNYWCENEKHKKELIFKYSENEQKYQEELRKKYNSNSIFSKKQDKIIETQNTQTQLIEYNESVFRKILNKIKKWVAVILH